MVKSSFICISVPKRVPLQKICGMHTDNQITILGTGNALATRRNKYTAEAKSVYSGQVIVPDDLETIAV